MRTLYRLTADHYEDYVKSYGWQRIRILKMGNSFFIIRKQKTRKFVSTFLQKKYYRTIKFLTLFSRSYTVPYSEPVVSSIYEGWNFNSGNYLFTTDTK